MAVVYLVFNEGYTATAGNVILLEGQDRARWDHAEIDEGLVLVEAAPRAGPPDAYAIQAAIAGLHARALSAAETNWAQIAALAVKSSARGGEQPSETATGDHVKRSVQRNFNRVRGCSKSNSRNGSAWSFWCLECRVAIQWAENVAETSMDPDVRRVFKLLGWMLVVVVLTFVLCCIFHPGLIHAGTRIIIVLIDLGVILAGLRFFRQL
jgi:hypothetical protein